MVTFTACCIAWEDATRWGYVKRNAVADASPPRVPLKAHHIWTVAQLTTFLLEARGDRFFALWVLEATTGMRRSELAGVHRRRIDFDTGTLTVYSTRVVTDGAVIEEDGKSDDSRRTIALDPYTRGVLRSHVNLLDAERAVAGEHYQIMGCCSAGMTAGHRTRTRSLPASTGWLMLRGSPASGCTTFGTAARRLADWLGWTPRR